jgi:DNA damage-binding protein 1
VVNKFIIGTENPPPSKRCQRLIKLGSLTRDPSLDPFTGSMSSGDSAPATSTAALTSQLLFFTSSGRIGVVIDVSPELSLHLTALERNLRKIVAEIAHALHAKYRAPVGAWGKSDADAAAYGFLDGDFLEKFLHYHHASMETERVLQGSSPPEKLKQTYGEIRQSLEALQALH